MDEAMSGEPIVYWPPSPSGNSIQVSNHCAWNSVDSQIESLLHSPDKRNDELVFHIVSAPYDSYDFGRAPSERAIGAQYIRVDRVAVGRHCPGDITVVDRIHDVGMAWMSAAHRPVNHDIHRSSNPVVELQFRVHESRYSLILVGLLRVMSTDSSVRLAQSSGSSCLGD